MHVQVCLHAGINSLTMTLERQGARHASPGRGKDYSWAKMSQFVLPEVNNGGRKAASNHRNSYFILILT